MLLKWIKSKKFYEISFIMVTLFSFSVWLICIFRDGAISEQFNLFFRRCGDFLADYLNGVGYSGKLDPYHNTIYSGLGEKAYPALSYVVMFLFSRLINIDMYYEANYFLSMYYEPWFLIVFLICGLIVLIGLYETVRSCKKGSDAVKIGTAFAILLSQPILYTIERANVIIISAACCIVYTFFYDSEKKWQKEMALICLAVAFALKITPAVLGILLLQDRRWKDAVKASAYALIFFLIPFLFLEGGLSNIPLMLQNIQIHLAGYSNAGGCTVMASMVALGNCFGFQASEIAAKIITYAVCALLFGFSFIYRKKWERTMAASIILIILPSHSGYYTIIYIIAGIIMFLNEKEHDWIDIIVLLCTLSIMCPYQIQVLSLSCKEWGVVALHVIWIVLIVKGAYRALHMYTYRLEKKK